MKRGLKWAGFGLAAIVAVSVLYLNQIGLPDMAKTRLQRALRKNGLDLEFSRLRLQFGEGVVAEDVRLRSGRIAGAPEFAADSVRIQIKPGPLFRGNLEVAAIRFGGGAIRIPLQPDAGRADEFWIEDLGMDVWFRSENEWELRDLHGTCLGLRISCTGYLTNALELAQWTGKRPPSLDTTWLKTLDQISKVSKRVVFSVTPEVHIQARADAKAMHDSEFKFECRVAGLATSPWGRCEGLTVKGTNEPETSDRDQVGFRWDGTVRGLKTQWVACSEGSIKARSIHDAVTGRVRKLEGDLRLRSVESRWAQTPSLMISGEGVFEPRSGGLKRAGFRVKAPGVETAWGSVDLLDFEGEIVQPRARRKRPRFSWQATMQQVSSKWGEIATVDLSGSLGTVDRDPSDAAFSSWGWWRRLVPFRGQGSLRCSEMNLAGVAMRACELRAEWEGPGMWIHAFSGALYDGGFKMTGGLDVSSRRLKLKGEFDFDLHRISHLLNRNGRRWIAQYTWETSPKVRFAGEVRLPEWSERRPDWRAVVKPTLSLSAHFDVGKAAFRGVPVLSACSGIQFTNEIWRLPDLVVVRPEGRAQFDYTSDTRTEDYYWAIDSRLHLDVLKAILDEHERHFLDFFQWSRPARVRGALWGRWYRPDRLGMKLRVNATNFLFRGEPLQSLVASGTYSNHVARLRDVKVQRYDGQVTAKSVQVDMDRQWVLMTNGVSTIDPQAVARAIGPATARTFKVYRFERPPMITIQGKIPYRDLPRADAEFNIVGSAFRFWRFHVPAIQGDVFWRSNVVELRNVRSSFYRGQLRGDMDLFLSDDDDTRFRWKAQVEDAALNPLLRDVLLETNRSKGRLSGQLNLIDGKTEDWHSWKGFGRVRLKEGFLWDTPLFGVFSHLLNLVSPGLGNSRARKASATFRIQDSTLQTRDLEIREPSARLRYRGRVDFDGHIEARVTAELLRDAPMLGRIFSWALWPVSKFFAYRVTGTLEKPEAYPAYILPRVLLMPLQPVQTIQEFWKEYIEAGPSGSKTP